MTERRGTPLRFPRHPRTPAKLRTRSGGFADAAPFSMSKPNMKIVKTKKLQSKQTHAAVTGVYAINLPMTTRVTYGFSQRQAKRPSPGGMKSS